MEEIGIMSTEVVAYVIYIHKYTSCISSFVLPKTKVNNFQEYTHYCTNFPKCEELLQHVMKSEPATRDFIIVRMHVYTMDL